VVAARNHAVSQLHNASACAGDAQSMEQLASSEASLGTALGRLNVTVEAYPDLKASENMQQLSEELSSTGITRGALEPLTRDELQGVIAHQFSHIHHGDMRFNLRLTASLHGIMAISLAGGALLQTMHTVSRPFATNRTDNDQSPPPREERSKARATNWGRSFSCWAWPC